MLGPHLMLDLYDCNPERLADKHLIRQFLLSLPSSIGMRRISEPIVLHYEGNPLSFDKGGISAFVFIAESHISLHTWPANRFASLDVFSCKPFDAQRVVSFATEVFEAKRCEEKVLDRGKEFIK